MEPEADLEELLVTDEEVVSWAAPGPEITFDPSTKISYDLSTEMVALSIVTGA